MEHVMGSYHDTLAHSFGAAFCKSLFTPFCKTFSKTLFPGLFLYHFPVFLFVPICQEHIRHYASLVLENSLDWRIPGVGRFGHLRR